MAERKPLFMDQTSTGGFAEEMLPGDTATFGGLTLGGDVVMAGNLVTGLGAGASEGDALSYGQTGAVMSGLDLASNTLTSVASGVNLDDAANVGQLNDGLALKQDVITAGDGLSFTGDVLNVNPGDGIRIDTDTVAVDLLDANAGLEFSAGELKAQVSASGCIDILSDGLAVRLDPTPHTIDCSVSGLQVAGLPLFFEIEDVATGLTVTAPNLDTLTNGSNADALHTHTGLEVDEAQRIENDIVVNEAIAVGDPVYWSSTADRVEKADAAVTAKSFVFGVARTAQSTVGLTAAVVSIGEAVGVLTGLGATTGQNIYLAAGGGLSITAPSAGNRVIRVGIAMNATDLWVDIIDYGKKAA